MLTQQDLSLIGELLQAGFASQEKKLDEKLEMRFASQEKKLDEKLEMRFASQEKKLDEKLDKRLAESEERINQRINECITRSECMVLDEIDRYYNLNKNAIHNLDVKLSGKIAELQRDVNVLKSRENVLDMYQIVNKLDRRVCALESKESIS